MHKVDVDPDGIEIRQYNTNDHNNVVNVVNVVNGVNVDEIDNQIGNGNNNYDCCCFIIVNCL